jgi:hypothetical protein
MIAARWALLGERRAISLLVLAFYTTIFLVVALAQGGAWLKCFLALAVTYGVGFFALAAEWFWARWFAMGLGVSGMSLAALGLVTTGWSWGLAIWGLLHALVYLPLLGESMAARYEDQEAWRRRYHLDDHGVARLKRAVRGAAAALPTMILYTLAPRQGQAALLLGLLLLSGAGLVGLLRLRVWGLGLLAAAGAWAGLSLFSAAPTLAVSTLAPFDLRACGALAALALLVAVAPFARPALRFLRAG